MALFKKKIFPKSLDDNLSDYPRETTIHGVKYLANRASPLLDRIFWISMFIVSISFLGYFVYKISRTWIENPVMITDQNKPTQVFEIPFPAVTICPQIKIKADKFDFAKFADDIRNFTNYSMFMDSDVGKKFIMASQICRRSFKKYIQPKVLDIKVLTEAFGLAKMPYDWIKTLHDISPKFDELFETCEMSSYNINENFWKAPSKKNCERLFSMVITNEGICFTFNGIRDILRMDSLHTEFLYHNFTQNQDGWDPEKGYTKPDAYPYKGIVKGSPVSVPGLKFVMKANLSDVTPFCFPRNVGYKISFHSPFVYPSTYENFIPLAYGKEYQIAAIPKTIKTNNDLRSFAPEVRNCFFNDERKLKFYTFYNEENCRLECYANYSRLIYGGVPFSSPRNSNTKNCILPHKNAGWDFPEFLELFQSHLNAFATPSNKLVDETAEFNCNCLPECNAIRYEYKVMKSNDDFSIESIDEMTVPNTSSRIIQTTFEIIFNEPSFIGEKRVSMYSFETMISDFGGLLGLFMGGSLLSLFELFYFLTIRNSSKVK